MGNEKTFGADPVFEMGEAEKVYVQAMSEGEGLESRSHFDSFHCRMSLPSPHRAKKD